MDVRGSHLNTDVLAIVEKYEAFVHYLYPILQCSPRQHGVLRDAVLELLLKQIGGLYHAARSRQVSRLHAVDADFATLRALLRLLAWGEIRILSRKQHGVALALLSEPGRMLGSWLKKLSSNSGASTSRSAARPMGQTGE